MIQPIHGHCFPPPPPAHHHHPAVTVQVRMTSCIKDIVMDHLKRELPTWAVLHHDKDEQVQPPFS